MSRDFIRSTGREFTRSTARDRNFNSVIDHQSLQVYFSKLGAIEYFPRQPRFHNVPRNKKRFQRIKIRSTHATLMSGSSLSFCEEIINLENEFAVIENPNDPNYTGLEDTPLVSISVSKSSNWPGPFSSTGFVIVENQTDYTRYERTSSGSNPFKIEVWLENETDTDHQLIRQMIESEHFGDPNRSDPTYSPGYHWEERIYYTVTSLFDNGKANDRRWIPANVPPAFIGQRYIGGVADIHYPWSQTQNFINIPKVSYIARKLLVSDTSGKRWEYVAADDLLNCETELSCGLSSIPSGVILPPEIPSGTNQGLKYFAAMVFPPHTLNQVFGTTPTCVQ